MIIICEPQCKNISHEKFNCGYIYGLHLAYPHEKIRFYADISHIKAIKSMFTHDHIIVDNIEYIPITYRDLTSILGILAYYSLFKKLFSDVIKNGADKIFFLSFSPTILFTIKKLKQSPKFQKMKFTFVLHGDFENIVEKGERPAGIPLPLKNLKTKRKKRSLTLPHDISSIIIRSIKGIFIQMRSILDKPWQCIVTKEFTTKKMLLWNHSPDFKYIANSPHIMVNAANYIDVKELNMYTVLLPTIFVKPLPQPHNNYVKFAIFGYGNSLMLYNVLSLLSQKRIKKTYEIRVISMDDRGTEGFPNITCIGHGKVLERVEMERYVPDIDMFLILYDISQYRLGCSGSILESLSYMKPVLHFDNDCINTFNTQDNPIGICCNNLEEFVDKMEEIIENYENYIPKFQTFRENILQLRRKYAIENSLTQLKESFTW